MLYVIAICTELLDDVIVKIGSAVGNKYIAVVGLYVILIIATVAIFWKKIRSDASTFRKNLKAYIIYILQMFGIAMAVNIILSMVVGVISKGQESVNQEIVQQLPMMFKIFGAVIYAPIVEEAVFRGTIRRFIKNDVVFIIVSGLAFGIVHILGEADLVHKLLWSIPYIGMGVVLARSYSKSNNVMVNWAVHTMMNIMATVWTLFK